MNNCNSSLCLLPRVYLFAEPLFLRPSRRSSSCCCQQRQAAAPLLSHTSVQRDRRHVRPGQTALPSPQWAQLHTSLRVALQAAFVFSVILARSSLHDALMGLEWVFGRKQWHLSSLLHQDSSSEAGPWSRVSTPWLARLLMALFSSAGWVQLDGSPDSAFESISAN